MRTQPREPSHDEIAQRIERLGPWFHRIELGDGLATKSESFSGEDADHPRATWEKVRVCLPDDLSGKSVLDVGCNAGFYSIEMKRRGAERVLGVDSQRNLIRQAEFVRNVLDLDIEYRRLSVYDLDPITMDQVEVFPGINDERAILRCQKRAPYPDSRSISYLSSRLAILSGPSHANPGEVLHFRIGAENTGYAIWLRGKEARDEGAVHLAAHVLSADEEPVACYQAGACLTRDVAPHEFADIERSMPHVGARRTSIGEVN